MINEVCKVQYKTQTNASMPRLILYLHEQAANQTAIPAMSIQRGYYNLHNPL